MQKFFPNNPSRRIRPVFAILLVFLVLACNRKVAFNTSTIVPAAQGSVKVKKDKNNNHAIDVEIRNLADPKRLPAPQNVYVVWIDTNNGPKNIGQLRSSSSLISSTLRAELETVTPFKPTRLFITAEGDANVQYPGSQIVLTTNPF